MATAPPPPDWSGQRQTATLPLGRPAGFWIRVVAYFIDGFILSTAIGALFGIVYGLAILLGASSNETAVGFGTIAAVIGMIVGAWLYEALFTASPRGATLGKLAIGARIVRADGAQLSFGRATARHFLKVLITPMVPLGIGYMLAGWTQGKRALHDLMADTLVVRTS